jgi:hypothetical protein
MAAFSARSSPRGRLIALWRAIAVPRPRLARVCGVPDSSRLGVALYLLRLWQLVSGRALAAARMRLDGRMSAIAGDVSRLQAFVGEE